MAMIHYEMWKLEGLLELLGLKLVQSSFDLRRLMAFLVAAALLKKVLSLEAVAKGCVVYELDSWAHLSLWTALRGLSVAPKFFLH